MSAKLRPKFITVYDNLLTFTPAHLKTIDQDQFWNDLFSLDVESSWLSARLNNLSREDCLGPVKPLLNLLCRRLLLHLSNSPCGSTVNVNALETLFIIVRGTLSKQMTGWEVMDVYAGGVVQSDAWFASFTKIIDGILKDEDAPVKLRHRTLQLVLVFMCGVQQLSPGAYFLRRDLYPSLVSLILSPKTQRFTFEATLTLCLLSNFHKSDAAKTNPYLNHIKQSNDEALMVEIGWIVAYAAQRASSAYQSILDDSPPTLTTSLASFVTSLRPDRALSTTPADPPKNLFKQQPIEAAVVLLPLHDFLHFNTTFKKVFRSPPSETSSTDRPTVSLPESLISLSSYILTHASSSSRSLAYAHLALSTLLLLVEDKDIIHALCQERPTGQADIRLCRQRPPYLPYIASARPYICSVLDCCVLWLRHNLQKRLEVSSYLICIRTLHRILYYMSVEKLRLDYRWEEIWRSLVLVLEFTANQFGSLKSVAKVDELVHGIISLFNSAVRSSEQFLPSPQASHQLVYELIRAKPTFTKQHEVLNSLGHETKKRNSPRLRGSAQLSALEELATYYQTKVTESNMQSADAVIKYLGQLIDQDGIHGVLEEPTEEPIRYSDYAADISFIRWACVDILALMEE